MLSRASVPRTATSMGFQKSHVALPVRCLATQKLASSRHVANVMRVAHALVTTPRTIPLRRAFTTSLRYNATTTRSKTKTSTKKTTATTKKAAPKKKKPAAKKKKAPAKKPAPKRVKKPLSDVEKKVKLVSELKKTALIAEEPKGEPTQGWTVFVREKISKGTRATESIGQLASQWKSLGESEKLRYNTQGQRNAASHKQKLDAFIASQSPDAIRLANNARNRLKRIAKEPVPAGRKQRLVGPVPARFEDPRRVARPKTAFFLFIDERRGSGDFQNMPVTEVARAIGTEWKGLSQSEKQRYENEAKRSSEQYKRDYAATYPGQKTR